jgi:hypothetical protein
MLQKTTRSTNEIIDRSIWKLRFRSSRMLRFAAGLGNSDFRGHVLHIFESDLTTPEDEGAASWYVKPITQYNIPEQQNLQHQQYGNFHYLY